MDSWMLSSMSGAVIAVHICGIDWNRVLSNFRRPKLQHGVIQTSHASIKFELPESLQVFAREDYVIGLCLVMFVSMRSLRLGVLLEVISFISFRGSPASATAAENGADELRL